ncbi:MAG: ABC transporter substrate-binding protein [Proteobacteria bacterium]|nr:ABC transporter substrate-binding protein [Pseudomonadota bacterium]
MRLPIKWLLLRRLTLPLLLACLAAGPAAGETVLRVIPNSDLRVMDPIQTAALITRMHALMIYDTLLAWDEKLQPRPMAAESYTVSPDGLKWTFVLRQGLKFNDGQALTTKDVIASLKRWMVRDGVGQRLTRFIASIDRLDDLRFAFTMKEPYGFVEYSLAQSAGIIPALMREKDAMTDPFTPVTETVGSGPFRFAREAWSPGNKYVYAKNPDYLPRSEPPSGLAGAHLVKVDRLEFLVIPDPTTAAGAIAKGEVDFWDTPPIDLIATMEKNPGLVVSKVQPLSWFALIRPNHLHPPFNNVKARQALALTIDQGNYMRAAIGDQKWWRECYSFFVCGSRFGAEVAPADLTKQNLERAKQLFAEAGYKGEKVVIISPSDLPIINAFSEVTADHLRQVGVNVDIQRADFGNIAVRWNNKSPPDQGGWNLLHAFASGSTWHHPLTSLGADMTCGGTNWSGWPCDEEAAKLRDAFIRAPDEASQKAASEALQRRLWQTIPFLMGGQYDQPYVWRKNIEGVLPTGLLVFWNISKS